MMCYVRYVPKHTGGIGNFDKFGRSTGTGYFGKFGTAPIPILVEPNLPYVLYSINTVAGHFGEFTTSIPVPDTSVS